MELKPVYEYSLYLGGKKESGQSKMVLCFFSWFLGFFHMDSLRSSFNTWFPLNSQVKRFISFCIDQISQIPIQFLMMLEWLYCPIFFFIFIEVSLQYNVMLVSAVQQSESVIAVCYCSVTQLCLTLCYPMNCSTPGFPCPSPSTRACSNSCPLSQWCSPTILSFVVPFSSCL